MEYWHIDFCKQLFFEKLETVYYANIPDVSMFYYLRDHAII